MIKVAVCGNQCAGKSMVCELLLDHFYDLPGGVIKFATPIYRTLLALQQKKNRLFMQEMSDLAKGHFGDGVFRDIFKESTIDFENYGYEYLFCDDLRYIKEADLCRELGYTIVFVDAPAETRMKRSERSGLEFIEAHSSEDQITEVSRMADYTICNSGSLDELEAMVSELVERIT